MKVINVFFRLVWKKEVIFEYNLFFLDFFLKFFWKAKVGFIWKKLLGKAKIKILIYIISYSFVHNPKSLVITLYSPRAIEK